jgi:hypothetical protein
VGASAMPLNSRVHLCSLLSLIYLLQQLQSLAHSRSAYKHDICAFIVGSALTNTDACMDAAIEQHSESFQCPICYELISSRHKSRVLPCGHGNVCEKDLTTLWKQAQHSHAQLKCPSQGCALPNCPSVDRLPCVPRFIPTCFCCNLLRQIQLGAD